MNRVIKFRGKRIDTGEWVYANKGGVKHQIITERKTFPFTVHPETVGQFTGLLDLYGKEIYEGDILSIDPDLMNGKSKATPNF